MHPSPEHHSWPDLEEVIRQKPAMVKHPIISQLGGKEAATVEILSWENKMRKERRGKGKLAVKFIVLPITSTENSCWKRTQVQLSSPAAL